jgi:hypothetical protein
MMLTLFSYPELYGLADNNPYGLQIYAFLRLCRLQFRHEHVFDAKAAPRGQLPYIVDDGETIGDSNEIVDHLIAKYRLSIDVDLTPAQQTMDHLLRRMFDDLYWVMSYSRWHDPRYWPTFRDEILRTHAQVTEADLEAAREYNGKRYYYQGIGRYAPEAWRPTPRRRRRLLRLPCQHLFLPYRHSAPTVHCRAPRAQPILRSDARCRDQRFGPRLTAPPPGLHKHRRVTGPLPSE